VLARICRTTGADLDWLITGKRKSFGSQEYLEIRVESPESQNPSVSNTVNKADTLLSSNPDLTDAVSAFLDLLAEKRGVEHNIAADAAGQPVPQPTRQTQNYHPTQNPPPASHQPDGLAQPGWIPVLGRTAAGITHFWDQRILPSPAHAVTQLEELVGKYLGKSILACENGRLNIDHPPQLSSRQIDTTSANLIQLSGQSDADIVEFVQCRQIHDLYPDSFALRVDGESMAPRINDGDIVVASPSVPAGQGQIAIARLENQIGVTCKLIRTTQNNVHLIPINENYPPIVVEKDKLLWAQAVLCHITI
ncbi:MAG: S24 family peptidase, partial [Planctomycetes bacterium]|nr:S24 family peptidase [Planctomycetota bacterium]